MWKVKAVIIGEFVTEETFDTFEEACEYHDARQDDGIYDIVEMRRVNK